MSDCLHCDINQPVEQWLEQGATDPGELVSMIVGGLMDLMHMAPEADLANLMAQTLSVFGQLFMEKGGAFDSSSSAAH